METVSKDSMILRLEHFYEKNEDAELSKPVTVSLEGLFVNFSILSLEELNLSANQKLADKKQLNWHTKTKDRSNKGSNEKSKTINGLTFELQPMEIRTFLVDIQRK